MPIIPIKDAAGIAGMRASCRLARAILEELVLRLEPGKTTGDVDRWAGELMLFWVIANFLGSCVFP